jgi:hypothetical protein
VMMTLHEMAERAALAWMAHRVESLVYLGRWVGR